jgi:hypothetical protein
MQVYEVQSTYGVVCVRAAHVRTRKEFFNLSF